MPTMGPGHGGYCVMSMCNSMLISSISQPSYTQMVLWAGVAKP